MGDAPQVVVIGGGVIGCSVAYELARRGAGVHVVERRAVGRGATFASAGVLAPYLELHADSPVLDLGARSLDLYDEFVAGIVEDSGSPVQYVRKGTLEVATDERSRARLWELGARFAEQGVDLDLLDAEEVRGVEPQLTEAALGGLLVRFHGFVGATELTVALRQAAGALGVTFVSSVSATSVARGPRGLRVETGSDDRSCDAVVLAAGSWSGQVEVEAAEPLPIRPVRGQLLHLLWPGPPLARVVWARDCYLVPWADGSVLVGATVEDVGFDERATASGVRDLINLAQDLVPSAVGAGFKAVRVGLRPATPDDLPVIGPSGQLPGLIYATGHYRNGILLAPLTASIVADWLIDGKCDPAIEMTSPVRFGEAQHPTTERQRRA